VAADTRTRGLTTGKFDTICKIRKYENFYYAFAGTLTVLEKTNLDLQQYFPKDSSIKATSSEYLANRYPALLKDLTDLYNNKRDSYIKNFEYLKGSDVLFFGVENDEFSLYLAQFFLVSKIDEPPKIDTLNSKYPYVVANGTFHIAFLGMYNAIDSLTNKTELWQRGIIEGLRILIYLQGKATPKEVAYPIDILYIPKKGKEWWVYPRNRCAIDNTQK
jgi:hypothetical protein